MTADLRAAYEAAAEAWAAGPERVYAPLARALVLAAPVAVTGRRVLDLGAGTGVAGRAALAAGADRVVSADLAVAMLRRAGPAQHPVAADAAALPFRDRAFDLVVAAFCLNHLDRPGEVLGEIRRVGHGLAASTFAPGWAHPAKLAVDQALRPFGYQPPAWYESMKRDGGRPGRIRPGSVTRPPGPGSPACGSPRSPCGPACRPRRSWHPGGWAWPMSPRSSSRWTRRARPPPGGPPSRRWPAPGR